MSELSFQEKERLKVISAYQEIFSTPAGKIVLEDLSKSSGFMSDDMDENPHVMAYNVGARQLFARILTTIKEDLHETIKRFELSNQGENNEK